MDIKKILILACLVIFNNISFSQNWPKIYLSSRGTYPLSVEKCYDRGFLIGGEFIDTEGYPIWGLLIKTDINCNLIWYKSLGQSGDGTGVFDVQQTKDHGLILCGSTGQIDSWGDPFIMKLNPCGEKEWCRIYSYSHEIFDHATSVYQIPGGYIAHINRGDDLYANDHIFLIRLDMNGNLVWQQQYALSDPLILGAEGEHMMVTPDFKYIISGWCYYPDSGTVNPKYLKPLLIKVDSTGTAEWEHPWSIMSGVNFYGQSFNSITDNNHNIYSCGRHIESSATPPGDRPTMLVTDPNGNELSFHDMVTDSWQAVIFTINWFSDSTIAMGGGWTVTGNDEHEAIFKVDRFGNIIDSVELLSSVYSFSDAVVDNDDKLFIVSPQHINNQWKSYAWKLNHNLQLDTLYTKSFVYDSLCPHPIASDTIPLDCVIVGLDEPFKNPATGRLKVWPNPVDDVLNIEIPDKLKTETKTGVYDLTTVYSRWKATIELYDLSGHKMFSKEISQSDKNLTIDLSSFTPGLYLVRLVFNGSTVVNEKVMVK